MANFIKHEVSLLSNKSVGTLEVLHRLLLHLAFSIYHLSLASTQRVEPLPRHFFLAWEKIREKNNLFSGFYG